MTKFIKLESPHFKAIFNTKYFNIEKEKYETNTKGDYCFNLEVTKGHKPALYISPTEYNHYIDKKELKILDYNKYLNLNKIIYKEGINITELRLSDKLKNNNDVLLKNIESHFKLYNEIDDKESKLKQYRFLNIKLIKKQEEDNFNNIFDYQIIFNNYHCNITKQELFKIQKELINLGKLLIISEESNSFQFNLIIINLNDIKTITLTNNGVVTIYNKDYHKISFSGDLFTAQFTFDLIQQLIL